MRWRFRSQEDAQADGARAGLLQGFDLAEANECGELVAFVDDGFGVGGSGFEGLARTSEASCFRSARGRTDCLD